MGSIPATIMPSSNTVVEAWANLLDEKQLRIMGSTEKNYYLTKLPCAFKTENGESFTPAYSYVHKSGAWAPDGVPISLTEVRALRRDFQSFTQSEALELARRRYAPNITKTACDSPKKASLLLQKDKLQTTLKPILKRISGR